MHSKSNPEASDFITFFWTCAASRYTVFSVCQDHARMMMGFLNNAIEAFSATSYVRYIVTEAQ